MFIDVCFPKGNEDKFIEVAERLDLKGLLFIYSDKRKATEIKSRLNCKLNAFCGFVEKKRGIFYEICVVNETKKFSYLPDFKIPVTQVHIKELAGFGFPLILQAGLIKNQKKAELCSRLSLVLDLCHKYGVRVVVASCATSPFLLLSCYGARAILKTLGSTKKY
jgi:hypothetical protein